MRFSDIKVKHVYNVIFDPVRDNEFDGKHLALVLKKNNDMKSSIVLPLTSVSNGLGSNKVEITVNSLPTSLKNNPTYAVYNQIRTVNANRFIKLKEGQNVVHANVDDKTFESMIKKVFIDMTFDISELRIKLLESLLDDECVIKAKSIAYDIRNKVIVGELISQKEESISELLKGRTITFSEVDKQNGIDTIIEKVIKK